MNVVEVGYLDHIHKLCPDSTLNSDTRESSKRKNTIFKTWRKFENKKSFFLIKEVASDIHFFKRNIMWYWRRIGSTSIKTVRQLSYETGLPKSCVHADENNCFSWICTNLQWCSNSKKQAVFLWSNVYWSSQSLANLFYTRGMVLLKWPCNYSN